MQFALVQATEPNVNVCKAIKEIHLQPALHVRDDHFNANHFRTKTLLNLFCFFEYCLTAWLHVLFLVPPPTEPSLDVGCSTNDECPDYTACENRQCINPCAFKNPCAPTAHCRVVRHNAICTCPDGYVGSPTTSCQPRKNHFFSFNSFKVCTQRDQQKSSYAISY